MKMVPNFKNKIHKAIFTVIKSKSVTNIHDEYNKPQEEAVGTDCKEE